MEVPLESLTLLVVAGVLDLILAIVFFGFFLVSVNTDAFLAVIEKDVRAKNFGRVVKIFRAIPRVPAARYGLFLFSLQIPRKVLRGFGEGFRQAAPTVDFAQVLEEESERARKFFEKPVHRMGAIGVVAAVPALLASVGFLLILRTWPFDGTTPFEGYPAAAVGLGVVAIFLGQSVARSWRKAILGVRQLKTRIQPTLVAKEDMSPPRAQAALDAKKHRLLEPLTPDV